MNEKKRNTKVVKDRYTFKEISAIFSSNCGQKFAQKKNHKMSIKMSIKFRDHFFLCLEKTVEAFCAKSKIETLDKGEKYVQSKQ